jgi:hypothetical protein
MASLACLKLTYVILIAFGHNGAANKQWKTENEETLEKQLLQRKRDFLELQRDFQVQLSKLEQDFFEFKVLVTSKWAFL